MRSVDKLSVVYARAELLSTLPVQQQDQSRAVLSLPSRRAAAEQAQKRLTLSPAPRAAQHPDRC